MPVITDVNANTRILGFENWISQIAGCEVKLLPEPGMAVRDVVFAILSQIAAIRIDYSCCIEINPWHLFFVHWYHNRHAVFRRDLLHELSGGPFGNALGKLV